MPTLQFTHVIAIADEEHAALVTGTFLKGYPAHPFGDYPEPGADDEFDVAKVEIPVAVLLFGKPTGKFIYYDIAPVLTREQIAEIAEQGVMAADFHAVPVIGRGDNRPLPQRRNDDLTATLIDIASTGVGR